MRSKKQQLKSWKVYAILDGEFFGSNQKLKSTFKNIASSPVDVIQFRFKNPEKVPSEQVVKEMIAFAREKGIIVLINDNIELALSAAADGVHLGKSDISPCLARKILGPGAIIGRTIRNLNDYNSLSSGCVDYAAIGPVFKTPLKPGIKTVSCKTLRNLVEKVKIPLVAIGGVNDENVRFLALKGIKTVAFVRFGLKGKNTKSKIIKLRQNMSLEKKC